MPNDTTLVRAFIAVEFSPEAREEFVRVEEVFKKAGADVKWVEPENVHITLKFLGNIPEEKIAYFAEKVEKAAFLTRSFEMVLEGTGAFPGWGYPKVIWIGIGEGNKEIKGLAKSVEDVLAEEGFEKENRPFSPHVTIGRVRTGKNRSRLKEIAESLEIKAVTSSVSRIILFRSDLSPKGPAYTPLATIDLRG